MIFSLILNSARAFKKKNDLSFKDSGSFFYDTTKANKADALFDSLKLGRLGLGRRAYDYAMLGYEVLKNKKKLANDKILSIIDFSNPSGRKRLFVIDVKNYKLLFVTYVAMAKIQAWIRRYIFQTNRRAIKAALVFIQPFHHTTVCMDS